MAWGRARDWTDDEKIEVLQHIYGEVSSGRSLNSILLEDENMPYRSTFWRWHMDDQNIRDNLARARLNGVEALMEEALHVAQTPQMGMTVTSRPLIKKVEGEDEIVGEIEETKREDMLGHRKLVVDTILKRAQMIAPRKYGPKMDITTDNKPITADTSDVAARVASLLAAGRKRKGEQDG